MWEAAYKLATNSINMSPADNVTMGLCRIRHIATVTADCFESYHSRFPRVDSTTVLREGGGGETMEFDTFISTQIVYLIVIF